MPANQVKDIQGNQLQRCVSLVADRFGGPIIKYGVVNDEEDAEAFPSSEKIPRAVVVYILRPGEYPQNVAEAKRSLLGVFRIDVERHKTRLRIRGISGAPDYDKIDAHVFNRVSASKEKGYMYFPYGYTYRMAGHGNIDEFGFRIDADLDELKKRKKNHKLICTFGGSTTWSIDCLPSETYTSQLQNMLNAEALKMGSDCVFTCLNFGQVAYSVLSELNAFVLFAWQLKPDFVIAHDGWNDLLYGSYTDPYLVQERGIVYPCDLVPWGEYLHDGVGAQTTKNGPKPYPFRSPPSSILKAYFDRKMQFKAICEAAGARFVWGLQPCAEDKSALSLEELELVSPSNVVNQDDWQYVRKRVPELLRSVARAAETSIDDFVDVGASFLRLGAECQHFSDNVHLLPEGDIEVAKVYFDYFKSRVFREIK